MNAQLEPILNMFSESGKRKIAIIGKGASFDLIDTNILDDFFIININDSERVCLGDICLFHHQWVKDFLGEDGGCQYYITSCSKVESDKYIFVEHVFENPDNYVPIQERFFDKQFYLEDATIISAIKISNILADAVREKIDVYLLGFDFTIESGFSSNSGGLIGFGSEAYVESLFNSQQAYFELLVSHESQLSINLNHVGSKPFSSLSCNAFNERFDGTRREGVYGNDNRDSLISKHDFKVTVVAEITTNHFGNLELLEKMIRAAAESGADYIKLQKRDVESFYEKSELDKPYDSPFGNTFRDYRLGLELDEKGFCKVDQWCKKYGIKWFASILDVASYEFIKKFEPSMIKLPSTISEHRELLERVASDFCGDVVLSTGMTGREYEEYILSTFTKCRSLYLLQCVSSYPTANEDANVAVVRHYHDLSLSPSSNVIPGYSSHDVGSLCCQLAVAAGALMVEKHVKYGNTPWAHFDNVAIDMLTDKFTEFVSDIRKAEICMGTSDKTILASEHHKYKVVER